MSSIEWTDDTWNPMVGCDRLSAGCDHCYAITMANRFNHPHYDGIVEVNIDAGELDWTGVINRAPDHIFNKPMKRRKPLVYFVNSMSDMFHERVTDADLAQAFAIMNACEQHTFQVLTKRPSRMVLKTRELGLRWTENIWAGTSIEEDKYARPRLRELLKVPAALRFVSAEPLLSALPSLDVGALDWLIVGGESGKGRTVRPMDRDWVRDLRRRCQSIGTPFFFKQWGKYGEDGVARSKRANGHLLDGEEIFEMPSVAFDRLQQFGRTREGWTRIEPTAELHPTTRFEASGIPFVVHGEPSASEDDFVLYKLKGDQRTYQNPNRKIVTEQERIVRAEAAECEARWLHLIGREA